MAHFKKILSLTLLLVSSIAISTFVTQSAAKQNPVLSCRPKVFSVMRPIPKLRYKCGAQESDWEEKVLNLPARIAAKKALATQLESFTTVAWWNAGTDELSVCDYTKKVGNLTTEQKKDFEQGEYLFWLWGNDRIRLILIPDPCYQTQYGGAIAFLLYRNGPRVYVTQVLDGYYSRADNSVNLDFGKDDTAEIIEVSTGTGGLHPEVTNYYFVIDPKTNRAVPRNLFSGEHGPTNEISSAMLLSEPSDPELPTQLQLIENHRLVKSFSVYSEDSEGKIDDNGRKLTRTVLTWNGKVYK
jgi:hypothetical protein